MQTTGKRVLDPLVPSTPSRLTQGSVPKATKRARRRSLIPIPVPDISVPPVHQRSPPKRTSASESLHLPNNVVLPPIIPPTSVSGNPPSPAGATSVRSETGLVPETNSENEAAPIPGNAPGDTPQTRKSPPVASAVKKHMGEKIARAVRTHRAKITANYLVHTCTPQGECMVFGTELAREQKLFGGFKDFSYATDRWDRVAQNSANGAVTVIHFERHGYKASAILKVGLHEYTDNLFYEFAVGVNFVNKMNTVFPCFLKTHGLYTISAEAHASFIASEHGDIKQIPITSVANVAEYSAAGATASHVIRDEMIDLSCTQPQTLCLLTQYFSGATTLLEFVSLSPASLVNSEMYGIIYQVYGALGEMQELFTHYDLHSKNVLLVPLPANAYIHFHYQTKDEDGVKRVVHFRSRFVVKIIDYGRCFYRLQGHAAIGGSAKIMTKVCLSKQCNRATAYVKSDRNKCGSALGYRFAPRPGSSMINLTPEKRNASMDLRLIRSLRDAIAYRKRVSPQSAINDVLVNAIFSRIPPFADGHSTPEVAPDPDNDRINTVDELRLNLIDLMTELGYQSTNATQFQKMRKLGDLGCTFGKPMRWVEHK